MDIETELFGAGRTAWVERVPPDLKEFLEEVADAKVRLGRNPIWAAVLRKVKAGWPDYAPDTYNTIQKTVDRLVEERTA